MEDHLDRVAEQFKDKTVFITGGTGFMGIVLIEKILRCTEPRKIYLLIRMKKEKHPQERIKDILQNSLFNPLKKLKGENVIDKLEAIAGDITLPGLGISEEVRRKLIDEVEFIYHSAASIRFDEPLKVAVDMNVRGTKFMLELAKECKRLMLFVHLSTAYCHPAEKILDEKVYPPPMDPHLVMDIVDTMSDDVVCQLTPQILGRSANTYVFTKALAEGLVAEEMDNLPALIMRPSIVVPIWLNPVPGWHLHLNGPIAIIMSITKGVMRSMYCNTDGLADYIPVDIAVNGMMLYSYAFLRGNATRVYHLSTSEEIKFSFQNMIETTMSLVDKIPLNNVVWYPNISLKKSKLLHNVSMLLFHVIPAVFVDALLLVFGFRPVLLYVQRRLLKGLDMYEYFICNQWRFKTDQRFMIRALHNSTEERIYRFDGDGLDFLHYFGNCMRFGRLHILKESEESLPAAKRHLKLMWFVDRFCKTVFFLGVIYYTWTKYLQHYFN